MDRRQNYKTILKFIAEIQENLLIMKIMQIRVNALSNASIIYHYENKRLIFWYRKNLMRFISCIQDRKVYNAKKKHNRLI